jgi:RIO-like serine/threonine protein kinase
MASLPLSSLVIAHYSCFFSNWHYGNVLVQEESDVKFLAVDPSGTQCILKIPIGKNSSQTSVKKEITLVKRELLAHSCFSSTLCLEGIRLMKAPYDVGYPQTPIAHNRHIVCMSLVRACLYHQIFQSSYRWNSRRHLRAVDWYGRPVG